MSFLSRSAESHNKKTKILHFSLKQLRAESQQLFKLFLRVIFQDNHSQGQRCGGRATHCQGASASPPIILCLLQIAPEILQPPTPLGLTERLALLNEGLATISIRRKLGATFFQVFQREQSGARGPRAGMGWEPRDHRLHRHSGTVEVRWI